MPGPDLHCQRARRLRAGRSPVWRGPDPRRGTEDPKPKEAPIMVGWYPMHSAPKDGTLIELWAANESHEAFWHIPENPIIPPGWMLADLKWLYSPDPSYWRPIPKVLPNGF